MNIPLIPAEMIVKYYELSKRKKEIDTEMEHLKKRFHAYFDHIVGENKKGEIIDQGMKLQRQIRRMEKYNEINTVQKLEELKLHDLIQVVKKPDAEKIEAAISLGFLKKNDIQDCIETSYSKVISVKQL